MTEAQQRRFYFPAWNKLAKARDWRMARGRLAAEPQTDCRAPELAKVWTAARQLALARHRAVTPDDLRHASHLVAIGDIKSSKDLSNGEVNRVVALWNFLRDPDDLTAAMEWQHPERAERRGLISFIRSKAPEAYIIAMTRNMRDKLRCDWTELSIPSLRKLARDVRDRGRKWNGRIPAAKQRKVNHEQYSEANAPF